MLHLNNASLYRGSRCLFDASDVQLPRNTIAGLIGQNGAGKSSLFALIQGQLHLDQGHINDFSKIKIAAMAQELPEGNAPLLNYVCDGDSDYVKAKLEIARAEQDEDGMAIAHAYADFEAIDGYRVPSNAAQVLVGLGFTQAQLDNPIDSFSGGWQMRAQLARVLLSRADLLLLDEPTNHLDLESVMYLQDWLQSYRGTVLVISHERDFLDHVVSHIIHLSGQKLKLYTGNYSDFARERAEAMMLEGKMAKKFEAKRAHMQSFVDRFRAKASKAKQAQGRIKALEKLTWAPSLSEESSFSFEFVKTEPLAPPLLTIEGDLGYGDSQPILKSVNWLLSDDARIGVIGVNGAGKSTFLKSISERLPLLSGHIDSHRGLSIGYYSQHQLDELDLSATPLQLFLRRYSEVRDREAINHLARFNFGFEASKQVITHFSGGELARLALALLIWAKPNCLILDEPTNHLDMQMREALISALQNFQGAVLLVSHDRYLLECVVDELLIIKDQHIAPFKGGLDDYHASIRSEREAGTRVKKVESSSKTTKSKSNVKGPAKDLEKIETAIAKLEKALTEIDGQLSEAYAQLSDQEKISALETERQTLSKKLEAQQALWLAAVDGA